MDLFFSTIIRSIKYGFQNFGRNIFLSIATTSIMVLTLFGLGFFMVINQISSDALSGIQARVDISVYLKEGLEESQVNDFISYVKSIEGVRETNLITKEMALEKFKETYKDNPSIIQSLQVLDENPLPVTLTVKAESSDFYQSINDTLLASKYKESTIQETDYQKSTSKEIIDRLNNVIKVTRNVGISVIVVLATIAVLITYNTIRLTLYSYRQEIEIMRLVGANDTQIKGPFFVEGVLFGVFGTFISFLILFVVVLLISQTITSFISGAQSPSEYVLNKSFLIIGIQLTVGIILGVGSSLIAINRYLKV
ncbi:ABC transporter permease [bacterium]|nr:ABC transporter permease [Candidatus Elulimicrobium humile]